MAFEFNGVNIDLANFNGVELDRIFFNGVEVFTLDEDEFLLDFDGVEDFYIIAGEENAFNMPATGEFTFGGIITFSEETPEAQRGFFGRSSQTDELWSYYFKFQGNGNLRLWVAGQFTNYGGFLPEFAGQTLLLEGRVTAGNSLQILVNGDVITEDPIAFRAEDNPNVNWFMGCMGNSTGTGIQNYYDIQFHNWFFQDEEFPCNEGEGLTVTGSLGTKGTIFKESQWIEKPEFKIVCNGIDENVSILNNINYVNVFDIDFEILIDSPLTISANDKVLNLGYNLTTGDNSYYVEGVNSTTWASRVRSGNVNLETIQFPAPTGKGTLSFKDGVLKFDETVLATHSDNVFDISLIHCFIASNIVNSLNPVMSVYNFRFDTEVFECNEGVGLTVTGDEGTVGTITREEMWEPV